MKIATIKGFSLVEVVVVMAIIMILGSITSFSYQRYVSNTNLRNAAGQLASDISNMKQQAILKMSSAYTISFDGTLNTYTMHGPSVNVRSLDSYGSAIFFNPAPASNVAFAMRGTLTPAQTITLQNNRGSKANIIYTITGKTYVTFDMH